jgi:hypothetical protein
MNNTNSIDNTISKKNKIIGWIAVGVSTLFAGLWAFWGAIENFHEGWYSTSLIQNIGLMLVQYAAPMLVFLILTLISLRFPRVGAGSHALIGILLAFYIHNFSGIFIIGFPLIILGALYWFGRPRPKKLAYIIAICTPLLIYIGFSVEPAIRVSGRYDDGNREARFVEGNNINLLWAPEGPGWSDKGVDFEEAKRICRYLKEDGKSLSDTILDIWRLPSVEEIIRSMTRNNINSKGSWDSKTETAIYEKTPDKESPLWNPNSKIIYWWSSTEKNNNTAYIVVYNGAVYPRPKKLKMGDLSFRAIKNIKIF